MINNKTNMFASIQKVGLVFTIAVALSTSAIADSRQSPVNIETKATQRANLPVITTTYSNTARLSLVNTYDPNGHVEKEWATLKADVQGGSFVMVDNIQYNLLQFHFHTPSEHRVNNRATPMEVHYVHLRQGAAICDADALLVIGAKIKIATTHAELNKIFGLKLPEDSTVSPIIISGFNLNKVLPSMNRSWRYPGSLTAPAAFNTPCGAGGTIEEQLHADIFPENVLWIVLSNEIGMSRRQIANFKSLFDLGNTRVTQPLNGRVIMQDRVQDDD